MHVCYLNPSVYCCEVGDNAIFLDVRTGKYFGVGSEDLPTLRQWVSNWPRPPREELDTPLDAEANNHRLLESLLTRDVLSTQEPPPRAKTQYLPAEVGLGLNRSLRAKVDARSVAIFARAVVPVLLHLKLGHMGKLLSSLHLQRSRVQPLDSDPSGLVATFQRIKPWFYATRGRCLMDSLVLARFLGLNGHATTFVIGVATKPFLAHAWVQAGDTVLNDTAEHVQEYTPLLVL